MVRPDPLAGELCGSACPFRRVHRVAVPGATPREENPRRSPRAWRRRVDVGSQLDRVEELPDEDRLARGQVVALAHPYRLVLKAEVFAKPVEDPARLAG